MLLQTACLVLATYKVFKAYIRDDKVNWKELNCLKCKLSRFLLLSLALEHFVVHFSKQLRDYHGFSL